MVEITVADNCPPSLDCSSHLLRGSPWQLAAKGVFYVQGVHMGTQKLSDTLLLSNYVQVYLNEKEETVLSKHSSYNEIKQT